jgi:hypothetical protein
MELLMVLAVSVLIGAAIGESRGRMGAGAIFALLLGPIGWLIVFLGPNHKKEAAEKKQADVLAKQFAIQQQQLDALRSLQTVHRSAPSTIRVAKDGQDLGDMEIPAVLLMLKTGQLTGQDYCFDVAANEWITIDANPDLC